MSRVKQNFYAAHLNLCSRQGSLSYPKTILLYQVNYTIRKVKIQFLNTTLERLYARLLGKLTLFLRQSLWHERLLQRDLPSIQFPSELSCSLCQPSAALYGGLHVSLQFSNHEVYLKFRKDNIYCSHTTFNIFIF